MLFLELIQNSVENDCLEILDFEPVQLVIKYYWQIYYTNICRMIFYPFVIYFVFHLICVFHIYKLDTKTYNKLWLIFVVPYAILIFYSIVLEKKQMSRDIAHYCSSFWNWIDLCSLVINIFVLLTILLFGRGEFVTVMEAVSTLLMFFRFFYFLRLHQQTAPYVRMII